MRRKLLSKKKKVAIVTVALLLGTAGAVAALWSANGSGSGQASSLTAQNITVTAATGAADLYPGFTQGDVYFTVSNPNPYPVTFTSISSSGITSSDNTACPSSNVTINTAGAVSIVVAAGASNVAQSIADVVSMNSSAPDGCQNKQFTITLTLTGSQS